MKTHTRQNVKDAAILSVSIATLVVAICTIASLSQVNFWTSFWNHLFA